jgi:outer membrane biosynthesis protein TonB
MSALYPRGKPAGWRLFWFTVLSAVLVCSGAASGYMWKMPEPPKPIVTELTLTDTNDAPPLGDPNAPQDQPPDPQPTPPPQEEQPTPPPLDKPPDFEIPQTEPTPAPQQQPQQPKPKKQAKQPTASHPAAPPRKGFANGVVGGTGNGGPRGNKFTRSPKPPYPPQALSMHITGAVSATITMSNGEITNVDASGPPMLASAAKRWIEGNWRGSPGVSGTFHLPINFVLH